MKTARRQPAVLGGDPAFPGDLPFFRPMVPPLEAVTRRLEGSFERGMLTNAGLVREFETAMAERLQVEHVVAVASCTTGLMLAVRALQPEGTAAMASFTFSATAHAAAWNGLRPHFVDCRPDTFQLDVEATRDQLDDAGVVMATHVFGTPCPAEAIEAMAAEAGVPVIFDAAAAMGAVRQGRPVGSFGDAEVFSLSPTKPVIAGEGGIVATSRADLAESVRIGRDYGNPGDYDTRFVGLNARMSELHAALGLESLARLDEHLARRFELADTYQAALDGLPGIRIQSVDEGDLPTWKDFTIAIDADVFGLDRDQVGQALKADGIDTRYYFFPPVHRQKAYVDLPMVELPVTESVAAQVITLPLFAALETTEAERVVEVLRSLHEHAAAVVEQVPSRR